MTLTRSRLAALLLGACALTFAPLSDLTGLDLDDLAGATGAQAKGGGGGGGSNGGGSGGGGGGGGGGKGGGGKGGGAKSGQVDKGGSQKSTVGKVKKKDVTVEVTKLKPAKKPAQVVVEEEVVEEEVVGKKAKKEKVLQAKLGGLNSLKRNRNGLLNSKDPRMEAIRAYVIANEELKAALEEQGLADGKVTEAETALEEALAAYDDGTWTVESLETRMQEIEDGLETGALTLTPELQSEIDGIDAVLDKADALEAAEKDALAADETVEQLSPLVTDEALTAALLAAANPNKVAEYGEENYVDAEMLDWAKKTLGTDPEI